MGGSKYEAEIKRRHFGFFIAKAREAVITGTAAFSIACDFISRQKTPFVQDYFPALFLPNSISTT